MAYRTGKEKSANRKRTVKNKTDGFFLEGTGKLYYILL
jgi:hypothetical protein